MEEQEEVEVDQEKDLPLMANADDIRVRHYMLKLEFNMITETVEGESIVFCDVNISDKSPKEFILDCKDLDIVSVEQIEDKDDDIMEILSSFNQRSSVNQMKKWYAKSRVPMIYNSEPWCLRIYKRQPNETSDVFKIIHMKWKVSNLENLQGFQIHISLELEGRFDQNQFLIKA